MTTMRARFLDLSQVQTTHVDFAKVKQGGYDGVVLKATEGSHYVDPTFDGNASHARAAGLVVGAYMFLTTGSPVQDQCALFTATARGRADFAVVDFESPPPEKWSPPNDGAVLIDRALLAASTLSQVFARVWVYSYPYFVQSLPKVPALLKLVLYPLWIASYHDEQHEPSDGDQPTVPAPWTSWVGWQWSGDKGTAAPGVPCVVDHNVYNGTREEFLALASPDGWEASPLTEKESA